MRAKTVNETLSGEKRLSISEVPGQMKDKFPFLRTLSFANLAEAINHNGHLFLSQGKLNYEKLWNFMRRKYPKWGNKSLNQTKQIIEEISPLVGIVDFLPLSREDRSEMKALERGYNSDLSYDDFKNAEISQMESDENDIVVRDSDHRSEPAFYRFIDETGAPKKLNDHERNFLRLVYALEHGDEDATTWRNYLYAVPAYVGHILKYGKSFERTRDLPPDYTK